METEKHSKRTSDFKQLWLNESMFERIGITTSLLLKGKQNEKKVEDRHQTAIVVETFCMLFVKRNHDIKAVRTNQK